MGWWRQVARLASGRGTRITHHIGPGRTDAGAEFRAQVLADSQRLAERPRPDLTEGVNSTWRWTGDRWQQWSVVWHEYVDVAPDEVPSTLHDAIAEAGVRPVAGDRLRFVDGEWNALDPGEADGLPADG